MAFRQIGNVLAGLVADPEKMRAALNEPAREFETPDQTSREATVDRAPAQDEPAHLLDSVRGLTPRAMGKVKKAGAGKAPASSDRGGKSIQLREEEMDAHRTHMRPALRLVTGGRGMTSASRRNRAIPSPALVRPMLLVIEGGHC